MAEYIDRELLLRENQVHITGRIACGNGRWQPIDAIQVAAITAAPAADVAPVTQGKWIDKQRWEYRNGNVTMSGDTGAKCTACGAVNFTGVGNSHTRFCPNCGARMENV
jgi:NADH pyrophosphatase NudC (nudix superfamily)